MMGSSGSALSGGTDVSFAGDVPSGSVSVIGSLVSAVASVLFKNDVPHENDSAAMRMSWAFMVGEFYTVNGSLGWSNFQYLHPAAGKSERPVD